VAPPPELGSKSKPVPSPNTSSIYATWYRPKIATVPGASRLRDGTARIGLQSHPRYEHHGHPAAHGRDEGVENAQKMKAFLHPNRILTSLPGAFLHDQDPTATLAAQLWCNATRAVCNQNRAALLLTKPRRFLDDCLLFFRKRDRETVRDAARRRGSPPERRLFRDARRLTATGALGALSGPRWELGEFNAFCPLPMLTTPLTVFLAFSEFDKL
jgi:hypothetical protein